MFSNVWSENTALFERLMEIHSNSPKLYYGFNNLGYIGTFLGASAVSHRAEAHSRTHHHDHRAAPAALYSVSHRPGAKLH